MHARLLTSVLVTCAAIGIACSSPTNPGSAPSTNDDANDAPAIADDEDREVETDSGKDAGKDSGKDSGKDAGKDTAIEGAVPSAPRAVEVSVGTDYHACVRFDTGQVKCWGHNTSGQLGIGTSDDRGDQPGEMGANLPFVDLGTGRTAVRVVAGNLTSCAVLDNGDLKCWGWQTLNRVGDEPNEMGDALSPANLGPGRTAKSVAVGSAWACALLDDGNVRCWGDNSPATNSVGNVDYDDALEPTLALGAGRKAIALSGSEDVLCILLDTNQVKCVGTNLHGELGRGQPGDVGTTANKLTDALPPVALGAGRMARQIAVSSDNACALLDTSQVKCWGWNKFGELGLGSTEATRGLSNDMGDLLPALSLGTGRTVKQVVGGGCAVLDDGSLKCWGNNQSGWLGVGDTIDRGRNAGDMGDALPAAKLGVGRSVVQVSKGSATCALLDNADVKCWGSNYQGSLGLGDNISRGGSLGTVGDALPAVNLLGP